MKGVMIEEAQEETMLGITFNKRLTWKHHLERLEPVLRQRIGILKRLRMKLPRNIACQLIEPIFISKLRYALELIADATAGIQDKCLKRLHKLHRSAMKAALMIPARKHPSDEELYKLSGQSSLACIALEATGCLAWKSFCSGQPFLVNRLESHASGRFTRQSTQRTFPPQSTSGTLISRLVEVWEMLPKEVKDCRNVDKAKGLICDWARGKDS